MSYYLIIFFSYVGITILSFLGYIDLDSKVIIGLSLTSIFMSAKEIARSLSLLLLTINNNRYSIKVIVEFLEEKIKTNQVANKINLNNVNYNVMNYDKKYTKGLSSVNFSANKIWQNLLKIENVFFTFGIVVFITLPFITNKLNVLDNYVSELSVFAFSLMMFSLFLNEKTSTSISLSSKIKTDIFIINLEYPEFQSYYDKKINYILDCISDEKENHNGK